MELAKLLQIRPGVTALIGSGGKTSTMLALADELGRTARVIVCTTTRILPPEGLPLLMQADAARAPEVLGAHGVVCIGQAAERGKLAAPEVSFAQLAQWADYVLVEADGSKRLPVKAHESYEPVVPPEANQMIALFGLSGLGKPIREVAHRAELYAKNLGVSPDTILTPQLAAAHACDPGIPRNVRAFCAGTSGGGVRSAAQPAHACARCYAQGWHGAYGAYADR